MMIESARLDILSVRIFGGGNGQMLKVFGRKLKFYALSSLFLSISATLTPNPALASPGCDAANNGTFTTSAPANMNTFRQFNTSFDIGDTLFATATGTPLGVGVDVLPGLQTVLVVNGANGSGSTVINNAGPHTVDITLAGGPGGAAFLSFSCTATMGPPTPPNTTPDANEQSNTATNATTTSVVVENGVVNGIVDGAAQQDPEPTGPTQAQLDERKALEGEAFNLIGENIQLEKDIAAAETAATRLENGAKHRRATAGDDYEYEYGHEIADLLLPIDVYDVMEDMEEDLDNASAARLERKARKLRAEIERMKAELKTNETRGAEIQARLEELPTDPNDFTPINPEDLGDGEAILFAPLDPFMRAINRYRGFTLNAAETTSGPGPNVTPLSFTRTLDPKTVGWVRAVYTDYEQDDASQQDGNDVLVAVGAHRDFTDNLRLGAFVTAKWGSVKSPVNALDIDTNGYSLGAYGRYRLGEEIDLNVSTRLGLTKNDISVSGTTGSYDTRLASFTVGVSGEEQLSDSVWMRPAISLTNTWVNREDYTNSLGTNIGGNTTWSGNLSAGPTIGTSLTPPEGFKRFEPAIGLLATYTYSDQDSQAGTVTTSETDYLSLSLSPQLSMEMENGMSLDLFGSYFGIGADLDGWSVGGTISIPLN